MHVWWVVSHHWVPRCSRPTAWVSLGGYLAQEILALSGTPQMYGSSSSVCALAHYRASISCLVRRTIYICWLWWAKMMPSRAIPYICPTGLIWRVLLHGLGITAQSESQGGAAIKCVQCWCYGTSNELITPKRGLMLKWMHAEIIIILLLVSSI